MPPMPFFGSDSCTKPKGPARPLRELSDSEFDAIYTSLPWTGNAHRDAGMAACKADACAQGRRACPTPEACRSTEHDKPPMTAEAGLTLALTVALSGVLAIVAISLGWRHWGAIVAWAAQIL